MYEISNNIPVPVSNHPNNGLTAQLKKLEIRQSILLPLTAKKSVFQVAKQLKYRIKTRLEFNEDGVMEFNEQYGHMVKTFPIIGIRVWRIS